MLEPFVRRNLSRWQGLYDRAPAPVRTLLTSARGLALAQLRYSAKTFAILRSLREHELWTADQVCAYQLCALQTTLDHARETVPFYRDYPALKLRDFDDLRQLPILERDTVRRHQDQLVSRAVPESRIIRAGTTGTTGANLRVAYTENAARANWSFLLRHWSWAGIEPRQPRLTLHGSRIVPAQSANPPFWVNNIAERQILLSIFHLSAKAAPAYLAFLDAHCDRVLEGFPSVLGILADFVLARGDSIPMHTVFTSGEPLYPPARRKIEQAFRARVFDSYGATEMCGVIQECERSQMHLIPDYGFLEILNEKNEPAAAGEEGSLVWTGFINSTMPLIRYRIGDRGRWLTARSCPCGRAFPLIVPTITRESDLLRAPDGRLFSPRALNQLLKDSQSLRCCQFIQDRADRVVVRAVASNGHAVDEMMQIRADLARLIGQGMDVIAELASGPLEGPGGKISLIVDRTGR